MAKKTYRLPDGSVVTVESLYGGQAFLSIENSRFCMGKAKAWTKHLAVSDCFESEVQARAALSELQEPPDFKAAVQEEIKQLLNQGEEGYAQ